MLPQPPPVERTGWTPPYQGLYQTKVPGAGSAACSWLTHSPLAVAGRSAPAGGPPLPAGRSGAGARSRSVTRVSRPSPCCDGAPPSRPVRRGSRPPAGAPRSRSWSKTRVAGRAPARSGRARRTGSDCGAPARSPSTVPAPPPPRPPPRWPGRTSPAPARSPAAGASRPSSRRRRRSAPGAGRSAGRGRRVLAPGPGGRSAPPEGARRIFQSPCAGVEIERRGLRLAPGGHRPQVEGQRGLRQPAKTSFAPCHRVAPTQPPPNSAIQLSA